MVDDFNSPNEAAASFEAAVPATPAPRPLQAGQLINGFRLDRHLHQGSTAHVWQVTAVDDTDPTPLVMKVPRAMGGEAPARIDSFEVEQMILPHLSGLHVPRFVAKGDITHQPYIVMERIAGNSLQTRLGAAPLPITEVADIGSRVAAALHELHRQHLVHLDVNPGNVLFRPRADGAGGEAVLIGFGLARHEHLPELLDKDFALPRSTAPYLSPEQALSVRNDPRSDLFALGVMLYQLTTGEAPFGAPDDTPAPSERRYREPMPPCALRPDCPPWLQEIILQALEPLPENRHATGAQLAFDLQHPEQVVLTERAARRARGGKIKGLGRWLSAMGTAPSESTGATAQLARSPMFLVAVDLAQVEREWLDTLRLTVERLFRTEPGARLACLTVIQSPRTPSETAHVARANNLQTNAAMQLKLWARPLIQALKLPADVTAGPVSFHVLEATDPASAIIDYAHKNQIDHIVLGARSSNTQRPDLGSVAAQVMAQCTSSVTVVRTPVRTRAAPRNET